MINPTSQLNYLFRGAALLTKPGIKRFTLIPIGINVFMFALLSYFFVHFYGEITTYFQSWLPTWLSFLAYLMSAVVACFLLIGYGYGFVMITQLIAAPFYGILAAKVEKHITGVEPPPEPLKQTISRTFKRELTKLSYFLSRGCLLLILLLIPVVNLFVPVIGFIWGGWSMAITYTDYCADSHRVGFNEMRGALAQHRYAALGFGSLVMLLAMVPVLNIIVIPAAVAGGTLLWIEKIRQPEHNVITKPVGTSIDSTLSD